MMFACNKVYLLIPMSVIINSLFSYYKYNKDSSNCVYCIVTIVTILYSNHTYDKCLTMSYYSQ